VFHEDIVAACPTGRVTAALPVSIVDSSYPTVASGNEGTTAGTYQIYRTPMVDGVLRYPHIRAIGIGQSVYA
jgi:hypothetical protein